MYSNLKCHFCNDELSISNYDPNKNEKFCNNIKCKHRYNVNIIRNSWVVSFRIKEYYFQMFHNVFDELQETLEIVGPNDSILIIPECRFITIDNYLEEVERAKKLQLFK